MDRRQFVGTVGLGLTAIAIGAKNSVQLHHPDPRGFSWHFAVSDGKGLKKPLFEYLGYLELPHSEKYGNWYQPTWILQDSKDGHRFSGRMEFELCTNPNQLTPGSLVINLHQNENSLLRIQRNGTLKPVSLAFIENT